jgi:peptidylprolyl isomerase
MVTFHMPVLRPDRLAVLTISVLALSVAVTATQPSPPQAPAAPADVAAPPTDAQKTASGLSTKVLEKGTGTERPDAQEMVVVHYTGWTTDGKMFDSSVARGKPNTFSVGSLIKGFTEGLQLMTVGEKRRLWIPESLAYRGQPGRLLLPCGVSLRWVG